MSWPIKEMPINSIFLDPFNIRLPLSGANQDALLQDLYINEDAFELAKSYAINQPFQDEFPIVTKEGGKYVVIEGNRRIAALKGLDDPDKVPVFKEKLKALQAKKIKKIFVVIAPSRAAAMNLIAVKHTTTARKTWKPLRQAYFYKSQIDNGKTIDQLKEAYPGVDIKKFIMYLEMHKLAKAVPFDDDDVARKVHDERKFEITNLERMYDDPTVQNYLGISFDTNGLVKVKTKKEDFVKAYGVIVTDVANGVINSREYNKANQRKEYVEKLAQNFVPQEATKAAKSTGFKEEKVDVSAANASKTPRTTPRRHGLIPSYIPFKVSHTPLKKLYEELRSIPVKDFPNATHDALRSFLERAVIVYLKQHKEYSKVQNHPKHVPKLSEMLAYISHDDFVHLDDLNVKQAIKHLKSDQSLERMNMANHNETWVTTEDEVRAVWTKVEPIVKILINPKNK